VVSVLVRFWGLHSIAIRFQVPKIITNPGYSHNTSCITKIQKSLNQNQILFVFPNCNEKLKPRLKVLLENKNQTTLVSTNVGVIFRMKEKYPSTLANLTLIIFFQTC
jgi:hypothetical protein